MKDEIKKQGASTDALILSQNLQKLQKLKESHASEKLKCRHGDGKHTKPKPTLENSDELLHQWYLHFFTSLQLAELASEIAMESRTLSAANQHFNPSGYLSQSGEAASLFKRFWSDAADRLADASVQALEAKNAYQSEYKNTAKIAQEMELGDVDAFFMGLDGVRDFLLVEGGSGHAQAVILSV
eukprot:3936981-Rhodomonas_salina.1